MTDSSVDLRLALEPLTECTYQFEAPRRKRPRQLATPTISSFEVPYRQWDGDRLPWTEDFGKGGQQVYSRDGADPLRSCNEVEVAKRLRRVRDHAFWISCYEPSLIPALWRPWTRSPEELPPILLELDREIRIRTGRAKGGIPDVVAWNGRDPLTSALLVECKRFGEDVQEGQEDWVAAALAMGLRVDQFAVAVMRFTDSTVVGGRNAQHR